MAEPRPTTGSLAAVLYDVEGDRIWHQRYILGAMESLEIEGAWDVAVATPDNDVYLELLTNKNPDILAVRWQSVPGDPPVGVPRAQWYRFRHLPVGAVLQRFSDRAERLLAAEARRRGVAALRAVVPRGEGGPGAGGAEHREGEVLGAGGAGARGEPRESDSEAGDPGLPARVLPWVPEGARPRGPGRGPDVEEWKAVRDEWGVLKGTIVQINAGDFINDIRTKGIHTLANGSEIFIAREIVPDGAGGGTTPVPAVPDGSDARVLPVAFDTTGGRHRAWRDVCMHADQPGEFQRLDAARATHRAVVCTVLQPPWRRSGGAPQVVDQQCEAERH